MKKQMLTVLMRKAQPGESVSREFPITEKMGPFIGYQMADGQTAYLSAKAINVVTEDNGDYYVVVKGNLQDANRVIDKFMKHPVDRFAGKPFNPISMMIKAMISDPADLLKQYPLK